MHFGAVVKIAHQIKKIISTLPFTHTFMGHWHNFNKSEFHTNLAPISHQFSINPTSMSHAFPTSHRLFRLCNKAMFLRCGTTCVSWGRCQIKLPTPTPTTTSTGCPILAHELDEATCDSDDLHMGSTTESAGKHAEIIRGQGHGKPMEGVCNVYPVDNLVTLHLGCDMVAL